MEELFAEAKLVIKTSLPTKTDVEMEMRYEDTEDILCQLEILIEAIYRPGGQYHKPGYTVTLNRD